MDAPTDLLRVFIEEAPHAIAMLDREMRYVAASQRWINDYGLRAPIVGLNHYEVFPEIGADWKAVHQRCLAGAVERNDGERFERGAGIVQWLRWEVRPWRLDDQSIGGILISTEDITERKLAEERLWRERELEVELARSRSAHDRLAGILINNTEDAIICVDENHRITLFNGGAERVFAYQASEVLGEKLDLLLPRSAVKLHTGYVEKFAASREQSRRMGERGTVRGRRKDGSEFPVEVSISKHAMPEGVTFTAVLRDITERVRTDDLLREHERRLRVALAAGHLGTFQIDEREGSADLDETALALLGLTSAQSAEDTFRNVHPDDLSTLQSLRATGRLRGGEQYAEFRVLGPNDRVSWLAAHALFELGEGGDALRTIGIIRDVTERRKLQDSQAALRENEQSLLLALEAGEMGTWDWDLRTNIALWNARQRTLYGVPLGDHTIPYEVFMDRVHPDDREGMRRATERIMSSQGAYQHEFRVVLPDGQVRWMSGWAQSVFDETGCPVRMVGVNIDVTERKRAESMLRNANEQLESRVAERTAELREEMRRHEDMQAALAQAQRLEAIGKLTGGVAHDSNNLLTVIGGNLEMLEEAIGAEHPGLKYLREAQAAVERKTQLNRRLLTAARRRKLDVRVLDLNQQVAVMSEMLRRVLGETITLTTTLHADLWRVALDAGELDAALLNLAINARDAMPRGGRLHISTKNAVIDEAATRGEPDLAPGAYVAISVTDSGEGIAPDILPRVFEPFFTTKGQGKGTGLGLATVHGFTKQSGGHVTIYSEPGRGTTVNIYFPRHDGAQAAASDTRQPAKDVANGSGETVLVVEDDAQVRAITCARLERLGYCVLEASDGPSALTLLQRGEHVDLVFSDIVMSGGMSGFELMSALDARAPDLPVLLTSGFDLDAVRNGERQFSAKVLQKPYSQYDLAAAVKAALARNPS